MSKFKVGDRVRVLDTESNFKGSLATVRKVPGIRGENSASVRVDGREDMYTGPDDGHSIDDDQLELVRPNVKIDITWQVQGRLAKGWVFKSFFVGGRSVNKFKTWEEAKSSMDRVYVKGTHRVVKVTRVSAEMVEEVPE